MITLDNGITITGATLLTVEEVKKLSIETRVIGEWWWICTPSLEYNSVIGIDKHGSINYDGYYVYNCGVIRPALEILNFKSSNLNIGDRFKFGDKTFRIISETKALCTEGIGECEFCKNVLSTTASNYKYSYAKKYVEEWFEETVARYQTVLPITYTDKNQPVSDIINDISKPKGTNMVDMIKNCQR